MFIIIFIYKHMAKYVYIYVLMEAAESHMNKMILYILVGRREDETSLKFAIIYKEVAYYT